MPNHKLSKNLLKISVGCFSRLWCRKQTFIVLIHTMMIIFERHVVNAKAFQ
jgi:hypothetical protein